MNKHRKEKTQSYGYDIRRKTPLELAFTQVEKE
jgi:hypothetical protein